MAQENIIEIPFRASDSELYYEEIVIPEGFEAIIQDGKIILRKKESEDEKIRKNCIHFLELQKKYHASTIEIDECIAWLEKQVKKTAISLHENKTCKENDDSLTCEDEKIRKALVEHFRWNIKQILNEFSNKKALAWLEKQNHDGKKWIYEDAYLKEKEQLIQDGIDEVLENPQKYGLEKQGQSFPILSNSSKTGKKWTEEDEHHWMMCLECVEECATQKRKDFSKTISWLKQLKQRLKR